MTSGSKTKFEQDLAEYFPELADLYAIMKDDKKVWVVVKTMIEMAKQKRYGSMNITYQGGQINMIEMTTKET